MFALSIQVPFPVFQGRDGQPLENGYVWIGEPNLNPQTNPVVAYFDAALTIPAPQPLRTLNGYVSRAGTPAQIYVDGVNFSILVQDSKGSMVYNFPDGTGISPDASGVIYDPPFPGGVPTTVEQKLSQYKSVFDFMTPAEIADVQSGTPVLDVTAAIQESLDADGDIFFPAGQYRITASLDLSVSKRIIGEGGPSAGTIRTQTKLLPQGNFPCFKNKAGTTGEQYNIEGFNIFWENSTPLSTESATKGNRWGFKFIADGVAQYTAPYSTFTDIEVNGAWYVYYDDSDNYFNKFKSVIGRFCRFGFYKRLGTLMHFEECGNSIGAQGFHFNTTISPILVNCAADSLTPDASTPGLTGNYFVDSNSVSILGWDAELALINGNDYSYINFTRTYGTITGFTGLDNDLNCSAGQFVSWFLFTDNSNVTVSGFNRKFLASLGYRFIGSAGNVATIRSIVSSRCTLLNSDVRAPSSGTPTNRYSVYAVGGFATVIDSVFDNQFEITTQIIDGNVISNNGFFGTKLEVPGEIIHGSIQSVCLEATGHMGLSIFPSWFGDVPITGQLHVIETGTGNFLIADVYKRGTSNAQVVTVTASSGLTFVAGNANGTIEVGGYSVSGNVKMKSIIYNTSA
jgi:hypothetical protein